METDLNEIKKSILQTAGEIFVEKGYRAATIRQICSRANVNIAAVNYYFGNKKKLYSSVLHHYQDISYGKYPIDYGINESDSPRDKISAFISTMMLRIFEDDSTPWFGRLLLRELIEPTGELDVLIQNIFSPSFSFLSEMVKAILGEDAAATTVNLCTMSIFGQCLYFSNSPSLAKKMLKRKPFSRQEIDALAKHISCFSLAALENYTSHLKKVQAK